MQLNLYEFKPAIYAADRPDVVLIHGTGGDSSLWRRQVDLLVDRGFKCLLPELRGHGGTPEPGQPTQLQAYICDLLQTLEASTIRYPAIFVGHSLGAVISMTLAQQRPELFVKVLAVSMPGQVLPIVADLFELFLNSPYEKIRQTWLYKLLPRRYQVLLRTDRYSMQQIVKHFRNTDFSARRYDLQCPVHFCGGGRDVVALSRYIVQLHKAQPNSTFKLFERSGHCCMDDEKDAFNAWFLEKIAGSSNIKLQCEVS